MRLISDLRYAVRALAGNTGVTAVCILTLALGIGANTAIFSVVNALLLRSLPYPQAEQLMMVYESDPGHGWPEDTPAPANFADWRARNRTFSGMAAFTDAAFNVTGFDEPERVMGFRVSAGMFPVLGVRPQLGRAFSESEDRDGAERVVVLGYGYWQRRFHGDARAIGAGLTLDDQRYNIVGVMPPGFAFPDRRAELWVPMRLTARDLEQRGSHYLNVVGRLKDGANLSSARNDMQYIGDQLAHAYPQTNTGVGVVVKPLRDAYVGDARTALIVILAAVGLVLLIACANISNLLLARAAARRREIAIRAALGAGRSRLIAQLLTESLALALAGGLAGVLIGLWGIEAVRPLVPAMLLNAGSITVDRAVFALTLAISPATGLLFGLAPALAASKMDLHDALKEGARGSSEGLASNRLRSLLVVSEIALALMLLVAAGLMIRSFAELRSIDPGYRADHVLTMRLTMPDSRYGDAAKRNAFFDGLLAQLQALPGVKSAGVITVLPNTFKGNSSFIEFEGRPAAKPGTEPIANVRVVSPSYFHTMGIPLLRGRMLSAADARESQPVILVNETLVRRYWPNEDPIGKRCAVGGRAAENPYRVVAGIVRDVRQNGLDEAPKAEVYIPYAQWSRKFFEPRELAIRTALEPRSVTSAARAAIRVFDPNQAIYDVRAMEDIHAENVAQPRFEMLLMGAFAGLAALLAAVGVYGVMSYSVSRRTNEIGIRVALGAAGGDVLRMVLRETLALALAGVALGLAGAFAMGRALQSLLFGVRATDPLTFSLVTALLLAVAALASYLPARRAARIDPLLALRQE